MFDTFGKRVLDNAWNGYHCCLFAYGQTGAQHQVNPACMSHLPNKSELHRGVAISRVNPDERFPKHDPGKALARATPWWDTATTKVLCRSLARKFSAASQRTMTTATLTRPLRRSLPEIPCRVRISYKQICPLNPKPNTLNPNRSPSSSFHLKVMVSAIEIYNEGVQDQGPEVRPFSGSLLQYALYWAPWLGERAMQALRHS